MDQELLLADILKYKKKVFWKTSLFVLTVTGVLEKKVMLTAYFKLLM